MFGLEVPTCLA